MVFTKYDRLLIDVGNDLEDRNHEDPSIDVSEEAKEKAAQEIFEKQFLVPLGEGVTWVRLGGGFGSNAWECLGNILMILDRYGPAAGRCML